MPAADDMPCCAGTGQCDDGGPTITVCDLRRRLAQLVNLARQFETTWAGERLWSKELGLCKSLPEGLARLALLRSGATRGLSTIIPSAEARTTSLWALAAAAIWRFGFEVRVTTFGRLPAFAEADLGWHDHSRGMLLFIENLTELWSDREADKLERLVLAAHGGLVPVFTEVLLPAPPPEAAIGTKAREAFTRRIQRLRADPERHQTRLRVLLKLDETTEGLASLVKGAERRVEKAPRVGKDGRLLPYETV